MSKRRYTLKRRAEAREETRRRIVEAAVRLHEEVGPRDTTISAIAEEAGVQRLTVYRHFSDETALFQACTAHWIGLNPPPDPTSWQAFEGLARSYVALASLYAYYRRTERMMTVSYRDEPEVPALRGPMHRVRVYLEGIAEDLAGHLPPDLPTTREARATLAHAVQFETWRLLAHQGLDDAAIVALVGRWLRGAAGSAPPAAD
jgi:AcrR family transcriptional regulator